MIIEYILLQMRKFFIQHTLGLSPKYIKQRWESLLIVAASMETWLTKETGQLPLYLSINPVSSSSVLAMGS